MTTRSLGLTLLAAFALLVFFGYSSDRKVPDVYASTGVLAQTRSPQHVNVSTGTPVPRFPELTAQIFADLPRSTTPWKSIVFHHSATTGGTVEAFDRYHRQSGDPNGIKYHFVIGNGSGMSDGAVQLTSRWRSQIDAAHLFHPDRAPESIAVCLVGNFESTRPTDTQVLAAVKLSYVLMQRFDIPLGNVRTHAGVEPEKTVCPGKYFPATVIKEALAVLLRQDSHAN